MSFRLRPDRCMAMGLPRPAMRACRGHQYRFGRPSTSSHAVDDTTGCHVSSGVSPPIEDLHLSVLMALYLTQNMPFYIETGSSCHLTSAAVFRPVSPLQMTPCFTSHRCIRTFGSAYKARLGLHDIFSNIEPCLHQTAPTQPYNSSKAVFLQGHDPAAVRGKQEAV